MPPVAAKLPTKIGRARTALAENLVRLRRMRNFTQESLAFEAGLHRTFVAHLERRARNPSLDNIEKLAIVLGVEAYDLLRPRKTSTG